MNSVHASPGVVEDWVDRAALEGWAARFGEGRGYLMGLVQLVLMEVPGGAPVAHGPLKWKWGRKLYEKAVKSTNFQLLSMV